MAATLREVSERLNLSQGLVSRVLNNRPGVRATPETIARIHRFARELDYEPSAAAKSLRVGKTNTVAFINVLFKDYTVGDNNHAAGGLSEVLHGLGYSLLVKVFSQKDDVESELSAMVRQRVCDMFLLWGEEHMAERCGLLLERLGVPFAVKGRHEFGHPDWIQVDYDHEQMIANCVRHLAGLGHRKIAYIGFDTGLVYQHRMVDGYVDAMRECFGEPIRPEWIGKASLGIETSERQMDRWLDMNDTDRPTAVVVGASRNPMWGMERALARRGKCFGLNGSEYATAGMINSGTPLLFGEAHGYAKSDILSLALAQAERQIEPVLNTGACQERIVRILPRLEPLETMRLQDIAI